MFGFIKNFFGGIFGFFSRLLGLKKSEYFLDLDDSSAKKPAKVEPATAKKAEPVAVAAAPEKVAPAKSATTQKAETTKKTKKGKESAASVPANTSEPAKVAAVAATNGKVMSQSDPILTFAPNNLMPTPSTSRRSPGPSMNGFREMARQMKSK
jgi:cytoskeletal protein RodZ